MVDDELIKKADEIGIWVKDKQILEKNIDLLIKWCREHCRYHHEDPADNPVAIPPSKYVEFKLKLGSCDIVCYNYEDNDFDVFPDDCRCTVNRRELINLLTGVYEQGLFHPTEIEGWLMKQTL